MTGPFLTSREIDVLERAAHGQTNKEIAEALGLAPDTVHTHRQNARQKVGGRNTAHAVYIAVKEGYIQ